MSERLRLETIADRVAKGEPVDWSSERIGGQTESVLRNLQMLERLAHSLSDQAANQDEAALIRHLDETFDAWLEKHGHTSDLSPPASWGRLRIDGLLGAGARADVLKAWDPRLERLIALKLFRSASPSLQEKLLAEGRRLARIDHPNVVRILEAEEHENRVGLLMEFVPGTDLSEWVERHGRMSEDEARSVGRTVCRAVSALHEAGVLHRDIKAQNVIRQEGGRIVLVDLGSGIDLEDLSERTGLSGTPLYLAPEVLRGEMPSVQSDIYSLGVLLFHLVSGRFPVEADELTELKQLHSQGRHIRLTDLQPRLDESLAEVIEKAIAVDPADRYQSTGELEAALAGVAEEPAKPSRLRRWLMMAVVISALALVWMGWSATRDSTATSPSGNIVSYQVDAELYLHGDSGVRRLEDGARIRVGDRLSLSVTADRPLYVYLFNVDDRGNAFGLFPLAALAGANPLEAGRVHQLPGSRGGGTLTWQVDRPGGTEKIHLVVSPNPVPEVEVLYQALPPASLHNSLVAQRGIGALAEAPSEDFVSAAPLVQAVQAMTGDGQRMEGAWHRVFTLVGDEP